MPVTRWCMSLLRSYALSEKDDRLLEVADHLEKLEAELLLYKNALWKACGDDEEVVEATLESQR